jgi:hypothetical protein
MRDLDELVKMQLLRKENGRYSSNVELLKVYKVPVRDLS